MDPDLVVQAQRGDVAAFESLMVANHHRLFRVAQGILRDPYLAEDATQQALVAIWRYLPRLRDAGKFDGWSYRLVVRACYAEAKHDPKWLPESAMTGEPLPVQKQVGDDIQQQGFCALRDRLGLRFRPARDRRDRKPRLGIGRGEGGQREHHPEEHDAAPRPAAGRRLGLAPLRGGGTLVAMLVGAAAFAVFISWFFRQVRGR